MPVKRRQPKRTTNAQAEAAAWEMTFETGHDFFGDLAAYGFPSGSDGSRAVQSAAGAAWQRLSDLFLEQRDPAATTIPWAVQAFDGEDDAG
jgi:hypothetical protein